MHKIRYDKVNILYKNYTNVHGLALCIFDYEYTKKKSVAIGFVQAHRQYSIMLIFQVSKACYISLCYKFRKAGKKLVLN